MQGPLISEDPLPPFPAPPRRVRREGWSRLDRMPNKEDVLEPTILEEEDDTTRPNVMKAFRQSITRQTFCIEMNKLFDNRPSMIRMFVAGYDDYCACSIFYRWVIRFLFLVW